MARKRMIERCSLVTDEEDKMTIEEIEEMHDASKVTPEQMSEILHVPFDEIDFEDDDMEWLDDEDQKIYEQMKKEGKISVDVGDEDGE